MQLSAEQVNEFLAKAVLESQIGDVVKTTVAKVLKDLQVSYQNPFEQVIRSHVSKAINDLVVTEYKPLIEAGVKAALQRVMTDEMMQKIIEAGISKLKSNY